MSEEAEPGAVPVTRCTACAAASLTQYPWCPHCRSTALTADLAGPGGTVYSFTKVWTSEAQYTLAYVDLDGGLRVLGRIAAPGEGVKCGARAALADTARDGFTFAVLPGGSEVSAAGGAADA